MSKQDIDCYNQIKDLRERFQFMTRRIRNDEELFVLARLGKNEDTKTRIGDLQMIISQLKTMLSQKTDEPQELHKIQNLMRNVEIVDSLFNKLFKGVYYDRILHRKLFQEALDFLCLYCHGNELNQQGLH